MATTGRSATVRSRTGNRGRRQRLRVHGARSQTTAVEGAEPEEEKEKGRWKGEPCPFRFGAAWPARRAGPASAARRARHKKPSGGRGVTGGAREREKRGRETGGESGVAGRRETRLSSARAAHVTGEGCGPPRTGPGQRGPGRGKRGARPRGDRAGAEEREDWAGGSPRRREEAGRGGNSPRAEEGEVDF